MTRWLFNVYMDTDESGDGKEGREWKLPGLLYVDDLVLYGELEEDLRAMVGCFFLCVYKRRSESHCS